jgi:hypothetical protein
MRTVFFVAFFLSMTTFKSSAQVISTNFFNSSTYTTDNWGGKVRLGVTNSLSLPSGKQLIIHGINMIPYNSTTASVAFIRQILSTGKTMDVAVFTSGSGQVTRWNGPLIGPMNLQIGLQSAAPGGPNDFEQTQCNMLLEIKDDPFQATDSSGANISSASVVVPANATGDVDVLLEQSTDMITWTQCLPGTYNASTQKRFFRVRAVEK